MCSFPLVRFTFGSLSVIPLRFRAGYKKSPTCRVDEWRACPPARLAEREQGTPRRGGAGRARGQRLRNERRVWTRSRAERKGRDAIRRRRAASRACGEAQRGSGRVKRVGVRGAFWVQLSANYIGAWRSSFFGWSLMKKRACGQAHELRVRVVKEESERKNKPCVCVRKELPEEFLKPL